MVGENVKLLSYVIRFSWVFVLFSLGATFFVLYFKWTGNAGLAVGSVMAAGVSAMQKFLPEQKRVLTNGEALRMTFYSFVMVLVITGLGVALLDAVVRIWPVLTMGMLAALVNLVPEIVAMNSSQLAALFAVLSVGLLVSLYLTYRFLTGMIYNGMVKRGEI